MMAFDPDAYLQQVQKPAAGFNPDAYLASKAPQGKPGVVPTPGAGWSWMDKLRNAGGAIGQSVADLAKSAAVPYLNIASMIPGGIGQQAQADVQALQKGVSPISQLAGGMLGGAPLAAGAAALGAPLAAAVPAATIPLAIGTGAGLGAATSPTGQRGMGAALGAAGAALPSALTAAKYGIGRLIAPGVASPEAAATIRAAQQAGLKVPPSELTGTPQVGREVAGSFGPFAKQVPEQNIQTFGRQVFKTLGMPGETNINAQSVDRAINKIAGDFRGQIGNAKLTINSDVANAVDSAITQNKAMLAEMAVDPNTKGVAAAIYRAQQGQEISGQDYYKVSQWLRNKAARTNDGATKDALESLDRAWQSGATGDTARVSRALRVYRTRMAQAMDLQKMMGDPGVAAGTKPIDPAKLYRTMAAGKPSVKAGTSPYKIAPLAQQAAVTQAFGTGTKVPGWAERAASLEGIAALGGGDMRLPYTGKLKFPQQLLFGAAGLSGRDVLRQLATEEGQKMLLSGYKLTPQQLQLLLSKAAITGLGGGIAATAAQQQTLP